MAKSKLNPKLWKDTPRGKDLDWGALSGKKIEFGEEEVPVIQGGDDDPSDSGSDGKTESWKSPYPKTDQADKKFKYRQAQTAMMKKGRLV
jgi:hypothetical protein